MAREERTQTNGVRGSGLRLPLKKGERASMVKWYDPRQLLRTASQVLVSLIFGDRADYRLLEALDGKGDGEPADFRKLAAGETGGEVWIDYVADTGDGFDSTYAIAYLLSRDVLEVGEGKAFAATRRGDLLIFGGDQVYPTPSRAQYERRLVAPYEMAMQYRDAPWPHLFAIPGNHDWYDGLTAFTRLFTARQWFGGWKTCQSRSYFAIQLPHNWWILGTDVQLRSDIDQRQLSFFENVGRKLDDSARVILCTAEPHWVYSNLYQKADPTMNMSNLALLEKKLGKKVNLFIAGDLHHYTRYYNDTSDVSKVTAGGGGAFLHPTHKPELPKLDDGSRQTARFPPPEISSRLAWRNLLFPFLNPTFGLLAGAIYVMLAWIVSAEIGTAGFSEALRGCLEMLVVKPSAAGAVLTVWAAFLVFTDTHFKSYRIIAGSINFLVHLAAVFLLALVASHVGHAVFPVTQQIGRRLLFAGAILFALGWLVGSLIMGTYLLISLNVFGRHGNEAFSSLHIPDWKNWVRMRIDARGALTVFAIGVRAVPRAWRETNGSRDEPMLVPADDTLRPELIETFSILGKRDDAPGAGAGDQATGSGAGVD